MNKKWTLVSDFDGTISDKDFFYYVADKYFDDKMLSPWREFLAGRKKHFVALSEMFGNLRIEKDELDKFIKTINLDQSFFKLAEWCKTQNIPVTICSAGNDYYINVLMQKEIKFYKIKLVSNKGKYSVENGLQMTPNKEYFDENLGVSKAAIVKDWQNKGYKVVYCGDGLPDAEAAALADKVFARTMLYDKCVENNVQCEKLENFAQVQKFMEGKIK